MQATCDKCAKKFDFSPITTTIGEVDIVYAECDCGKRYLSHLIDDEIEGKLKEIHELISKYQDKDITQQKAISVWDTYEKKVAECRKAMKAKESEYEDELSQWENEQEK